MSDETGAETQAEDETLLDSLSKGWDEIEAEEAPEQEAAPVEETEDEAEESEEAGETEASDEEGEAEEAEPEPETFEAPQHWSAEDRELFDSLDDSVKPLWLEKSKSLESGYQDKFQSLAREREELERYKGIGEVLAPYRQNLQMSGLNETAYVQQLVSTAAYLQQNPVEGLKHLARQYGVDMSAFVPSEEDEYTDPQVAQLNQRLDQIQGSIQTQQQQAALSQTAALQKQIDDFQNATDESGNPAHPHFEKVRGHMQGLLASETAKDLQDAYDQAVWAVPEIRSDLLKLQQEKAAKERDATRKAELAKAKKAGKKVKTSKADVKVESKAPANSWSEELSENWDALAAD